MKFVLTLLALSATSLTLSAPAGAQDLAQCNLGLTPAFLPGTQFLLLLDRAPYRTFRTYPLVHATIRLLDLPISEQLHGVSELLNQMKESMSEELASLQRVDGELIDEIELSRRLDQLEALQTEFLKMKVE